MYSQCLFVLVLVSRISTSSSSRQLVDTRVINVASRQSPVKVYCPLPPPLPQYESLIARTAPQLPLPLSLSSAASPTAVRLKCATSSEIRVNHRLNRRSPAWTEAPNG